MSTEIEIEGGITIGSAIFIGIVPITADIATEDGNLLITQSGDNLVTEFS